MTRVTSWLTPERFWLFLALLLFIVLWFAAPQKFDSSDPWAYSRLAFAISEGLDIGRSHVFNHRLAITIPTAFFYSLFGVNIRTTNLLPLCAALTIIVVVWRALPDKRSKIIGSILCLTSVPLFQASVVLFPDIVVAALMALSSLMLFSRRAVIRGSSIALGIPVLAVGFLFAAFLAKLSSIWVLPLWAWSLVVDLKCSERNVLLRRFYVPVFISGLCLGAGYLVFCYVTWDDPLARFKAIQAFTGKHLWAWDNASIQEMVKRLTISPVRLFINQYGILIFVSAVLGVVIAPRSIRPWVYYVTFCLLFYWFGSTSFTLYEPMPLIDRMTLPMLPGLYILAAFMTSRLNITSDRPGWINSFLPILLVLGLAGLPFAQYVNSWRHEKLPEAAAMAVVQQEVGSHPSKEYLLLCSDTRSPRSLSFYFGYHYPDNLHVESVMNLSDELPRSEEILVFINRKRSRFLESAYGHRHYDAEIDSLVLSSLYEADGVVLLRAERQESIRQLMLPNNRMESDR